MSNDLNISEAWRRWRVRVDLAEYNKRWDKMEAVGRAVHGEADFLDAYPGRSVLDAGCGTGRVAAELARRGRQVTGVDNDEDMLAYARLKPEPVRWQLGDLATVALGQRFDLIVMAGNILTFVTPSTRPLVIKNLAAHLAEAGLLVSGSGQDDGCRFGDVDRWCSDHGLTVVEEFATWDRDPFEGGDYRVVVHGRAGVDRAS